MSQIQVNKIEFYKEKLQEMIQKGALSHYQIHFITKKKNNVYVEKDYKIESLLETSRSEVIFHIYKNFETEIGEASFTLNENSTEEEFIQNLKDSIFMCSYGRSKKYSLPNKGDAIVDDSQIVYSDFYNEEFFKKFERKSLNLFVAEKLQIFKKLIEKSKTEELYLVLNAFEFHNSIFENKMETSEEIVKSYKKNSSYMEFVLTTKNLQTGRETEHIVYENINDLLSFDFNSYFRAAIEHAKDSALAKKSGEFKGVIILNSFACKDFFNPDLTMNSVIAHCSSKLKFQGISNYEKDKEILETRKDKLTIYSNALMKHNSGSSPYDEYGISGRRLCLIENGQFKNFFASKKYADYLGIEATGPLGVIEVLPGLKSENALRKETEYIEIISFSSFVPDAVSGDFSSEIRLGYHYKDGIKTPFKGGLFTGNIFELVKDIELSSEKVEEAGYVGPKIIKFYGAEIVGL